MIFWISGVGSRALSIGKGLESVAALVSDFDENSSSFVENVTYQKIKKLLKTWAGCVRLG